MVAWFLNSLLFFAMVPWIHGMERPAKKQRVQDEPDEPIATEKKAPEEERLAAINAAGRLAGNCYSWLTEMRADREAARKKMTEERWNAFIKDGNDRWEEQQDRLYPETAKKRAEEKAKQLAAEKKAKEEEEHKHVWDCPSLAGCCPDSRSSDSRSSHNM